MSGTDSGGGRTRRDVLRGVAGGAGVLAATGTVTAVSAPDDARAQVNYQGWFADVSNFDGTDDRTGESSVTVGVGVEGNGSYFAFGPPAIRVDPGTEVVWEWTGRGGGHNVVDLDGAFESELTADEGHTFTHTFESEGVYRYYCGPHRANGMKGAVVVGDVTGPAADSGGISWSPPGDLDPAFVWLFFGSLGLGVVAVLGAEVYREFGAWRTARAEAADVQSEEAPAYEPTIDIGHDEFDPTGTAGVVDTTSSISTGPSRAS
jgi:halocyanin-like protein